jgi:hypothetical protein
MLSKEQIITAIQQINQTARTEWLGRFPAQALQRYLDHLEQTQEPRGGHSIWVRPSENRAFVTREPA